MASPSIPVLRAVGAAEPTPASINGAGGVYSVVCDVDAHSQCQMRVIIKDGVVTKISGESNDTEGRGELTLRGQHMLDILYAPDRLKYPLLRTGEKGSGKWRRISWEEALQTIADRFTNIKNGYRTENVAILLGCHKGYVAIFNLLKNNWRDYS